jgi:hypothetical protein
VVPGRSGGPVDPVATPATVAPGLRAPPGPAAWGRPAHDSSPELPGPGRGLPSPGPSGPPDPRAQPPPRLYCPRVVATPPRRRRRPRRPSGACRPRPAGRPLPLGAGQGTRAAPSCPAHTGGPDADEVEDRLPGRSSGGVDEVDPIRIKRPPDHASDLDRCGHCLLRIHPRDVPQILRMVLRDHQDVAGGGGVNVHDGDHKGVFVDALGRLGSGHDRAEDATRPHVVEGNTAHGLGGVGTSRVQETSAIGRRTGNESGTVDQTDAGVDVRSCTTWGSSPADPVARTPAGSGPPASGNRTGCCSSPMASQIRCRSSSVANSISTLPFRLPSWTRTRVSRRSDSRSARSAIPGACIAGRIRGRGRSSGPRSGSPFLIRWASSSAIRTVRPSATIRSASRSC